MGVPSMQLLAARKPAAAGGFAPDDIAGMLAWWDASDAASFTYSSGTIVSTWADKSSAGNDLSTGAGSPNRNVTIGGVDAVVLASGAYLQTADPGSALSAPVTMLCVIRSSAVTNTGASQTIVGSRVGASSLAFYTASANVRIFAGTVRSGGTVANTTSYTLQYLFNGASNGTARVDGGTNVLATGSQGTAGPRGFQVGALAGTATCSHTFGEICVYDSDLSLADMNDVGDYLAAKWGTTWTTAT